jgi:hypothetical protein
MAVASVARHPVAVWVVTRAVLLLFVLGVAAFPGPDVTTDVSVIYQGWHEILRTGTYPLDDVTWQYPPGAALAILAPGLLPGLGYASAFFLLTLLCDLLVLALLLRAGRAGAARRGTWVWVAGVPLLGPTVYARYDLMVTAAAVGALLAGVRRPRVMGALAGLGALLKVWPLLVLLGTPRGRATRRRLRPSRWPPRCRAPWPFSPSSATGAPRSSRWARSSSMSGATSGGRVRCCSTTARWSSSARTSRWSADWPWPCPSPRSAG